MYGYGYGGGPWIHGSWMFGGGISMLIWVVLIAAGVAFVVRVMRRPSESTPGRNALEILRERYARGEIEKEEFDRKQRELI